LSKLSVIGSGFSGLSAACFLAKQGHKVTVFEKNSAIGGRARMFKEDGFMFDMGPSWYWMPDIFEHFFNQFGKSASDYYQLEQLDPGFQMFFGKDDVIKVPAKMEDIFSLFESLEEGSASKLKKFLTEGEYKYRVGMQHLIYKPSFSWLEFINWEVIRGASKLQMFTSVSSHVRSHFKNERLVLLMEFPVLFLGAMAKQIPALYSLMNYAALSLGTWYPKGGMIEIVKAMENLALELGVDFKTNCQVNKINMINDLSTSLDTAQGVFDSDGIVASGDYHHIEQSLLEKQFRNYDENYWQKKTFAPSCLIFYVGVNKSIKKLEHHNLFFDTPSDVHAKEIYEAPKWPENPLFYVCCPSKTDEKVAPVGMENLFLLIPIAPGLEDTEQIRNTYFEKIMGRIEHICGQSIVPHIVYKRSFCVKDFVTDYNAFKGNAYGLANTLKQTAVLKPSMKNKKVKNMFYAGQLTVPGPGVPPALVSGQVVAEQLINYLK
jgi:phytoene desaturase